MWHVSVYSSEIYWRKHPEHLHNDNHSHGLAMDCPYVGKSVLNLTTNSLTKASFHVVFFFASWTALLHNVALWCHTAAKSHFRRWSHACLIPLGKACTKVKSKKINGAWLQTPGRCLLFVVVVSSFLIEGEKKKNRKASHFAVLYNTVSPPHTPPPPLLLIRLW